MNSCTPDAIPAPPTSHEPALHPPCTEAVAAENSSTVVHRTACEPSIEPSERLLEAYRCFALSGR